MQNLVRSYPRHHKENSSHVMVPTYPPLDMVFHIEGPSPQPFTLKYFDLEATLLHFHSVTIFTQFNLMMYLAFFPSFLFPPLCLLTDLFVSGFLPDLRLCLANRLVFLKHHLADLTLLENFTCSPLPTEQSS